MSKIYFWNRNVHVSDSISVHHQESSTVHTALPVRPLPLLRVQCQTPDDGQRYFSKHVQFYSKNKFEKLVHLVGFIVRIVTMHGPLNVRNVEDVSIRINE